MILTSVYFPSRKDPKIPESSGIPFGKLGGPCKEPYFVKLPYSLPIYMESKNRLQSQLGSSIKILGSNALKESYRF